MVGLVGTETMPGVFAPVGMEYGHKYGGTSFELFARIAEKNNALDVEPASISWRRPRYTRIVPLHTRVKRSFAAAAW
jgi:hypothetical protein